MQQLDRIIQRLKSPEGALVLGLVGLALGTYQTWFTGVKPEVSYAEIVSSSILNNSVLIPSLDIRLNGATIDPKTTQVRIDIYRIWNSGQTSVRLNDFDAAAPLTLRVTEGTAVFGGLDGASNDYLRQRLITLAAGNNSVVIPPVILEPRDWFSIKFLTIEPVSKTVKIEVTGKLAGIDSLTQRFKTEGRIPGIYSYQSSEQLSARRRTGLIVIAFSVLLVAVAGYKELKQRIVRKVKSENAMPRQD